MIAQALLTDSIYMSLQDKQHQPDINSGYMQDALLFLNYLLDEWKDFIPFAQFFTFTNVDQLTATNFVSVSNVNFVLGTVQTPLERVTLTRLNEIKTVRNLTGIPQVYYFDELNQTIEVYPRPANPSYSFTVWGRIAQQPLTEFDELPTNMPPFMRQCLVYEIAFRLAGKYGVPFDEKKDQTRQWLYNNLLQKRDIDLSAPRDIVFGRPGSNGVPPFPYFYYMSGGGNG